MNRNPHRNVLTAVAAALLLTLPAGARAEVSREQVRAELAEARTQGLLDRSGEVGASDAVLLAREQFNQTRTQVLIAQRELDSGVTPEQVVYLEAGRLGPLLVKVTTAADGSMQVDEGPLPASTVALWVPVDFD